LGIVTPQVAVGILGVHELDAATPAKGDADALEIHVVEREVPGPAKAALGQGWVELKNFVFGIFFCLHQKTSIIHHQDTKGTKNSKRKDFLG
jgi:hypothetical protein